MLVGPFARCLLLDGGGGGGAKSVYLTLVKLTGQDLRKNLDWVKERHIVGGRSSTTPSGLALVPWLANRDACSRVVTLFGQPKVLHTVRLSE